MKTFFGNRLPCIGSIKRIVNTCEAAGNQLIFVKELYTTSVTIGWSFRCLPGFTTVVAIKAILKRGTIGSKISAYNNQFISSLFLIPIPDCNGVSAGGFFALDN